MSVKCQAYLFSQFPSLLLTGSIFLSVLGFLFGIWMLELEKKFSHFRNWFVKLVSWVGWPVDWGRLVLFDLARVFDTVWHMAKTEVVKQGAMICTQCCSDNACNTRPLHLPLYPLTHSPPPPPPTHPSFQQKRHFDLWRVSCCVWPFECVQCINIIMNCLGSWALLDTYSNWILKVFVQAAHSLALFGCVFWEIVWIATCSEWHFRTTQPFTYRYVE